MQNIDQALSHLKKDPVLAKLIDQFGVIDYPKSTDYFESLVSSIIGQQLSNKAADTIYNRFKDLLPKRKVTPQAVLDLNLDSIRKCGTSWAKASYLHDLATKTLDGTLALDKLETMADEEMITHLTQVKGIGRWSAQMQLMFAFHRPDIFPVDDMGIQNAFVKLYKLTKDIKLKTKMEKVAKKWQPYRTLACWYLWKFLDNK